VHLEPAARDREFEARAVLGWAAAVEEVKRLVDFLDVDAALNWRKRVDGVRSLLRCRSREKVGRHEILPWSADPARGG
jgi:hypothetical protein